MGRFRDLGWAIRDRAGGIALVLALAGCGAGVAGIVIALDAKDKAEDAAAIEAAPTTSAPPTPADPELQATVEALNERVGAIEESVSQLREELGTGTTTTEGTTTPEGEPAPPATPELPEELPDLPGVGEPESEEPAP